PHPEELRHLQRRAVGGGDHVAIAHGLYADVSQQVVARRIERRSEPLEVEQLREAGVEQPQIHAPAHVGHERRTRKAPRLQVRAALAERPLVQQLGEQARRHRVERRVVLHVLQGDLDDRLVELFAGHAVEQHDLELGLDLCRPRDGVVEARAGLADRIGDLVPVVRDAGTVALDDGDVGGAHAQPLGRVPAQPAACEERGYGSAVSPGRPTRPRTTAHLVRAVRWQVFGLTGQRYVYRAY